MERTDVRSTAARSTRPSIRASSQRCTMPLVRARPDRLPVTGSTRPTKGARLPAALTYSSQSPDRRTSSEAPSASSNSARAWATIRSSSSVEPVTCWIAPTSVVGMASPFVPPPHPLQAP